ncbi:hypothetical protein GcC1_053037 [Golovinomyces cichoracearum]|uniref:Uncharacterized protein n=1 Tax=Golovinomyces cichoracearum TaxID=62708 RepID=A0A420IVX1_9PEZI|nr:hypothetical protein GcC1_053037 [Golovinomyces cichoracearum]
MNSDDAKKPEKDGGIAREFREKYNNIAAYYPIPICDSIANMESRCQSLLPVLSQVKTFASRI